MSLDMRISTKNPKKYQAKVTQLFSMVITIRNTTLGICEEAFDAYVLNIIGMANNHLTDTTGRSIQ